VHKEVEYLSLKTSLMKNLFENIFFSKETNHRIISQNTGLIRSQESCEHSKVTLQISIEHLIFKDSEYADFCIFFNTGIAKKKK
jgi:hypothetical protein